MTIAKATAQQLRAAWREEDDAFGPDEKPLFEMVREETDPDDHGYAYTYVFKRLEDETFWSTSGVSQGGGVYHTLNDGDASDPTRVWPHTVSSTEYRPTPN